MQPTERIVRYYKQANDRSPFKEWIEGLDKKARQIIFQRIDRIRLGNFGDCRSLGSGIYELRIFWGPGYRVYYGLRGIEMIILLCGGDKSSQEKDIRKAHQFWKEI